MASLPLRPCFLPILPMMVRTLRVVLVRLYTKLASPVPNKSVIITSMSLVGRSVTPARSRHAPPTTRTRTGSGPGNASTSASSSSVRRSANSSLFMDRSSFLGALSYDYYTVNYFNPWNSDIYTLPHSLHLFDHQCTQSEVHDGHGKQRCITDMVGETT